jgi:Resolvase, N terminal domain
MTIKRTKAGHPAARAKRRLRPAAPKVARARSFDAGDITSKPMLIGYARVSTVDQNFALQRDTLTEAGCAKIFTEQMSGAVTDRPALHARSNSRAAATRSSCGSSTAWRGR